MILPPEWLENSIESYTHQQTTHSQRIYWVVLVAVLASLVSLPFIYVDISVQGNGIVRPIAEKTEIKAPITELVDSVYVREGVNVNKGDVILTFRASNSDYKIAYQANRLTDYELHLSDLSYLAKGQRPPAFSSPVRQQQYAYYVNRKKELDTSVIQAEKEYYRNKILFEKQVISEEEYDKYYYQYESQKNERASFTENQLSSWQADLNAYRNSRNEMNTSLKQEVKDKDLYVVQSPVSGTVDQFSGIYRGSSIQAGQVIAVVSPDSTLCFEVCVSPRNIGYIHVGMPVNVQVESFNYNEWGTINGAVQEISSDFLTDAQGSAYYKVKCGMEKDFLLLKNGRKGKLKKGMTVSAHFMITRRSLFDLLYQRLDDWVNPARYQERAVTENS
ncbi:HlyD family secretion protein [Bacteroides sp. 51]|uniref:HlyD family secretion protein n=1 Tax=Bacteroides sp. 51 TaxID=2302938 RepID=UPI0013D6C71C|nr:HlyD family efflux transporter periplasmic adaptor subunit [Bacteroides sp. 51]NDV82091.1 HlyD family efflux transporter periplasmic adaptor subunit [Bacteroides sp. 51]